MHSCRFLPRPSSRTFPPSACCACGGAARRAGATNLTIDGLCSCSTLRRVYAKARLRLPCQGAPANAVLAELIFFYFFYHRSQIIAFVIFFGWKNNSNGKRKATNIAGTDRRPTVRAAGAVRSGTAIAEN